MVNTIKYFTHILNTQMHTHIHTYILTALQCNCNDQFWLSDCRHNGWTCTARGGTGVCATRVRLLSNGTISRETRCLDMRFNPFHCSGRFNTNTDVWQCCNNTDYCNEDLSPTLNLPAPTQTTLAASSSSAADVIVRTPSVQVPSEHSKSSNLSPAVATPTVEALPPSPFPTPPGEENFVIVVKPFSKS